jgi:hypothetical protein
VVFLWVAREDERRTQTIPVGQTLRMIDRAGAWVVARGWGLNSNRFEVLEQIAKVAQRTHWGADSVEYDDNGRVGHV